MGIASGNDIAIYCNISFKYCDILQYIAQVSHISKTRHILLKLTVKKITVNLRIYSSHAKQTLTEQKKNNKI